MQKTASHVKPSSLSQSDIEADYLFDLQGYRILDNALSPSQLKWINEWVDMQPEAKPGDWFGHVEAHTYQGHDGINYQNIIEGGRVFEELIDNPAWIDHVRRYEAEGGEGISLNEAFLNVRASGGFIGLHSGGQRPTPVNTFRHHTGRWFVGQINILMALEDIGPGDGATTVVPGSHKSHAMHPAFAKSANEGYDDDVVAGDQLGMQEVHLKAGQAIFFTDAITHGSSARKNPGNRRVLIYRYSPSPLATRYNYIPSPELMSRLTPERQKMVVAQALPRMRPGRTLESKLPGQVQDLKTPN